MNVSAQIVSSQTPGACPQECPGDVVRSEGPPWHTQNPGNDPVQLPQAVEKSGQQNYHTAVTLEKIIEVLLSLRVDLELVQRGPAAPAANRVADAVPDRGRNCYEDDKQCDAHPSLSRFCRARHKQSLSGRRDTHAFRHHGSERRAVTVALQPRLHSGQ